MLAPTQECLEYILEKEAGSDPATFQGGLKRDCDPYGNVLHSRRRADGRGMRLADFLADPISLAAELNEAQVVGTRLYSTAAYMEINNPLRDWARFEAGTPHPLPITATFLFEALNKLRLAGAYSDQAHQEARE